MNMTQQNKRQIGEAYFMGLIVKGSVFKYDGTLHILEDVLVSRDGRKTLRRFKLRGLITGDASLVPFHTEINL